MRHRSNAARHLSHIAITTLVFLLLNWINELVFLGFEQSKGINWVFIPAGIRLLAILRDRLRLDLAIVRDRLGLGPGGLRLVHGPVGCRLGCQPEARIRWLRLQPFGGIPGVLASHREQTNVQLECRSPPRGTPSTFPGVCLRRPGPASRVEAASRQPSPASARGPQGEVISEPSSLRKPASIRAALS